MLSLKAPDMASAPRLAGLRLLWWGQAPVEDTPLRRLLRAAGAAVSSGALLAGELTAADAVVVDVEQHGMEAVGRLVGAGLPIVALTATADPERHAAALALGAAEAISVTTHPALLLQRLLRVARAGQQTRQQRAQIAWLHGYLPAPAAQPHGAPERISATLLFSDLRGFTAASVDHDAAQVFDIVNRTVVAQVDAIQSAGGYVDGFSGDGLLALFEGPESAAAACEAARRILCWAEGTAVGPWEKLPVALGLHHGEVVRGDLGGGGRRVFTALGLAINVAARLCGVASAREAVASQTLIARLPPGRFCFHRPRPVALKGIPTPLPVQTLLIAR